AFIVLIPSGECLSMTIWAKRPAPSPKTSDHNPAGYISWVSQSRTRPDTASNTDIQHLFHLSTVAARSGEAETFHLIAWGGGNAGQADRLVLDVGVEALRSELAAKP